MNRKNWLHHCCFSLVFAASWPVLLARADEPRSTSATSDSDTKGSITKERVEREIPTHRTIYFAKHAAVRDLVFLLGQHFDGEAGVKLVAEPNSNLLSIRAASPAVLEEVLKTLAQIDRPLRQIAFQVLVVEFNAKKSDGTDASPVKPEFDTDELTGSAEDVLEKLGAWTTAGHVAVVRKYQLTTHESQMAQLLLGETKPIVSGFTTNRATGLSTPTLMRQDVGTQIMLKPRISEAGEIVAELSIQDTRLEPPEHGIELAKGANDPIISRGTVISRLNSSLTIADGKSSVATGWQVESKSNHVPGVAVISARIVDPNKPRRVEASEPTRAAVPATPSEALPRATAEPRGVGVPPGNAPAPPDGFRLGRFGTASISLASALRDEAFAMRLNLTDEQKKKLDQLRMDLFAAMRSGTAREEMPRIVKEFEENAVKVLNEEQKKIWEERQAELMKAAKEREKEREGAKEALGESRLR